MFHGMGGRGGTMVPIGDYCAQHLYETRFLPIEGPINLGSPSSPCLGWFEPPRDNDRTFEGPNRPPFKGLKRSLRLVHETMDELVNQGVDPRSMHLLGHSQGGAIALAAGLTYPKRLGSVCTVAAYLALTPDMHPFATGTSYFLHHSMHDDNVSFRWAQYARFFVERAGSVCIVHPWDIRDMPHSIHPQQLDAICATIAGV